MEKDEKLCNRSRNNRNPTPAARLVLSEFSRLAAAELNFGMTDRRRASNIIRAGISRESREFDVFVED